MPSENLTIAKVLNILAWIVLGGGVLGIALMLFFLPAFSWTMILPLVIALVCVLLTFVALNVLARILRTVTYLYQLSWEQFRAIGNNIDELDGVNDGDVGIQCSFCGAKLEEGQKKCLRCGKEQGVEAESAE